jgi:hypothetical protein
MNRILYVANLPIPAFIWKRSVGQGAQMASQAKNLEGEEIKNETE